MNITNEIKQAVIKASIGCSKEKTKALKKSLKTETKENAKWALNLMLQNIKIANKEKLPLCDDTGTPHILIEIGKQGNVSNTTISQIKQGIREGLNQLPGRPMAVKGNDTERIEQSKGLYNTPDMVKPAPIVLDTNNKQEATKIHILFLGGGPEIRSKTYRIFHKHSYQTVVDETIKWLEESLKYLGCTPSIPCIGIGRTHFEATSLMLKSMVYGNLENPTKIEEYITNELNKTNIGPMGLGGKNTVLGSFVKIGNQRASGVRIVSARPSCFVEPRVETIKL